MHWFQIIHVQDNLVELPGAVGITLPTQWQIYKIKSKKGLIFIKNPFTSLGQRYWITRCLRDYTKRPKKLNIDAHNYLKESEDWWTICSNDDISNRESLLRKLRWSTLGYHHDWDTKVNIKIWYSNPEKYKVWPMPMISKIN